MVVGGGVIGLTTALVLARAGWHVTVLTADRAASTTSAVAAGAWYPTRVGPRDRVLAWGRRTVEVLTELETVADTGVRRQPTRDLHRQGEPDVPWWAPAVGGVRAVPSGQLPAGFAAGWDFVAPLAVMPRYLTWLERQLRSRAVPIVTGRVEQLAEAAAQARRHVPGPAVVAVIDCAGLAARALTDDPDLHPVRGEVLRVPDPGLSRSLRVVDDPQGPTYVHPRGDDVVLGGTTVDDVDDLTPDARAAAAILDRCRALVPQLAGLPVLEHRVGLRPGRPTIRCELDRDGGDVLLVHHYGHGGAGLTCSWGSAERVLQLLEEAR